MPVLPSRMVSTINFVLGINVVKVLYSACSESMLTRELEFNSDDNTPVKFFMAPYNCM